MPFVVSVEAGRHVPRIFCDRCGARIEKIDLGGVVYPAGKDGARLPVRVLCKMHGCLENDPAECWQELSHWLVWLLQSVGVWTVADYKNAVASADMLASFSL